LLSIRARCIKALLLAQSTVQLDDIGQGLPLIRCSGGALSSAFSRIGCAACFGLDAAAA
jgi:hypothetical protein